MRTVTFADPKVVDLLNERFVVVWNNLAPDRTGNGTQAVYSKEEMAVYPEGGGGNNLHTAIAAPDGTVLNVLTGYWSAATFLEELEFALQTTRQNRGDRQEQRFNALVGEAAKLLKDFPAEASKRPKDSAVMRRAAALQLLAACHAPRAFLEFKGVDEYLDILTARSRPRVHV